jgi:hypothetical protein
LTRNLELDGKYSTHVRLATGPVRRARAEPFALDALALIAT